MTGIPHACEPPGSWGNAAAAVSAYRFAGPRGVPGASSNPLHAPARIPSRAEGHRVCSWVLSLAALMFLMAATGCERRPRAPQTDDSAVAVRGAGMNVLLVSLDTVRADCLGCYGHPTIRTPNIDRLASEGTRFAQCISSAPLTLPSHSTMMTGSYQFVHGARDNGDFVLGENNVTLAEIFRPAGYATHAEVAAVVLNRRYGLAQGFDTYRDLHRWEDASPRTKAGAHATTQKVDATAEDRSGLSEAEPESPEVPDPWAMFDRKADDITRRAIEALAANRDRHFFIFLHYFDAHQPYDPPERFAQQYQDRYLGEIAFVDEQFGKLMDALRELGLAEKTLVVLTSDHGEGRSQHGEETHSFFLYDTTQHVPLIMACPGKVPAGQVVSSQVRLLDLAPTLVDFAALARSPQMQGTSLLPLLADPTLDLHLPCYADSPVAQRMFGYSMLRSIRDQGWKYILTPTPELYHVAQDPLELVNLVDNEPQRAAALRAQLRELVAESPLPPGGRATPAAQDPEDLRKLKALGYAAAGASPGDADALALGTELDHFEPTGVNPRDRLEAIELANIALGALLGRRYDEAERRYRRLLELEPHNAKATVQLADAVAAQDRRAEAEGLYRDALRQNPGDVTPRISLAQLLARRGAFAEAETEIREAVRLAPTFHVPHELLANVLGQLRRFDEAFVEYEAAASLAPDVALVRLQWALTLRTAGRLPEAEAQLRRACTISPDYAPARLHLAYLLAGQGRRDEAIRELLTLVAQHPDDTDALELLGTEYTRQGDYASAEQYYKRAAETTQHDPRAMLNLGLSLAMGGQFDEAIVQYRKAVEAQPDFRMALAELAQALVKTHRLDEAVETYERLLALRPAQGSVYSVAATAFDRRGDRSRAVEVLRAGHAAFPGDIDLANDLAWRLATSPESAQRDGAEAVRLAEEANATQGGADASTLDTLAAAYAEAGRFDDAAAAAGRARETAVQHGESALAARITERLKLYQAHQPYHEPVGTTTRAADPAAP